MDGSMRMNSARARSKRRQSVALQHLRDSVAGSLSSLRSSGDKDDVDDLVMKVLKGIEDEAKVQESQRSVRLAKLPDNGQGDPSVRMAELEKMENKEFRVSQFWTYFLAIPIIFTHGVATRMQFMYGALYGRDGLHLNNTLAILAVGFTAMGRATAPPLLRRFFNKPHIFMFLNAATLIGCSMMFAIPYVGGVEKFDDDGNLKEEFGRGDAKTVSFFYFSMYIQGLAEVLSGWDLLMKFEMRNWEQETQQLAFRVSFVSIALGSATAFAASSWLFEYFGLFGCAWLGVCSGGFNVIFPGIYLYCRWGEFALWRTGGDKKRSVASRKSQPLMRMLKLDEDPDHNSSRELRKSTTKLKFQTSKTGSRTSSIMSSSIRRDTISGSVRVSEYVEPRNYFEFQKQLQHQTSERLVNNFRSLQEQTKGFVKEQLEKIDNDDLFSAFDPNLLLTHSKHIKWPKNFHKQIYVMKWFCILALALGSMMISSQFAVYVLYLVDVWDVPVVFAGTSMAAGEISGMFTLLFTIYLEKRQAAREAAKSEEDESNTRASTYTTREEMQKLSTLGTWRSLLKRPTLVFQVPSMFVVTCFLAVVPLGLLGSLSPDDYEEDNEDPPELGDTVWSAKLIIALSSGVAVGIVNCVMHATTIEMAAMLLPEDLFGSAIAWGYSFRRITNLMVCLMATGLYELSPWSVYQMIASVYAISVPASIYILGIYIKCMPWQKREVVFESTLEGEEAESYRGGSLINRGSLLLPRGSIIPRGTVLHTFREAEGDEEDEDEEEEGRMLRFAEMDYDESDASNLESSVFEKLIEHKLNNLYGTEGSDNPENGNKKADSFEESGEEKKAVTEELTEEAAE